VHLREWILMNRGRNSNWGVCGDHEGESSEGVRQCVAATGEIAAVRTDHYAEPQSSRLEAVDGGARSASRGATLELHLGRVGAASQPWRIRTGGHGDWAKEEERGKLDISHGPNLLEGKR
jgi:hypothetical protein